MACLQYVAVAFSLIEMSETGAKFPFPIFS